MTEDGKDQRDPNVPGRRDTDTLAAELDAHIAKTEERLSRWLKRGLVAFGIIGITCAVALCLFGMVLKEQKSTADQLETLVQQNRQIVLDIQQQRRDATLVDCEKTNARNAGTQKALKDGSDQDIANAPTEAAKDEIRRRRDVTIGLINAVSPVQDCQALVKEAVQPPKSTTPIPTPTETP